MNFTSLFAKKNKDPEPEYFLAVEIHESLIKTALWEVKNNQPDVVQVGSFELWEDEDSLINGIDSSLDQAVNTISGKPNRVIFGLPDSWMEDDKIHPTKTKLVSRICKDLGLEPIGVVTINRAIAHYLKKRDGVPPTAILLEVYTTKIALSYIYLGEVKSTEEVAKSGDTGSDVEEGLTRMELPNYPARFILTNGSDLVDESQQVTAHPWQDRLPFKHLPKVESLAVDFSIRAIALIGGTEAVKYMGLEIDDQTEDQTPNIEESKKSESVNNITLPAEDLPDIKEHGFYYEEVTPPTEIATHINQSNENTQLEVEHAPEDDVPSIMSMPDALQDVAPPKNRFVLPKFPKINLPKVKLNFLPIVLILALPLLAVASYFFFGKAVVMLHFSPQSFSQTLSITVSQELNPQKPVLLATTQKVSGSTSETVATTGTATVGDRANGVVTIANKTTAPLVLKKGTLLTTDNGKYSFSLDEEVTIASASANLLDIISGKVSDVKVTATKIGPEYNLTKDNTLTVDTYSRSIAVAVAEKDFAGGTSRSVNAVSKDDQDKLMAQATEKIKQLIDEQVSTDSPGKKTIPISELELTKKTYDKTLGEESTTLSLDLEGSMDTFVYEEQDLFQLVDSELKSKLPPGNTLTPNSTNIKVESIQNTDGEYLANITVNATLYPEIDENKLSDFIKGKSIRTIRHFFEPIKGFTDASVKITPPIPVLSQYLPFKNISFQLVAN